MSELTTCNYCDLQSIKRRLKKGDKLEYKYEHGGTSVYINGEFVCWFMELTNYCCC